MGRLLHEEIKHVEGIRIAYTVSVILSLFGALQIIVGYWLFKEVRNLRNLTVVLMAISSAIGNAALLLSWTNTSYPLPSGIWCWIQGFCRSLFPFMSVGIALALSINVLRSVRRASKIVEGSSNSHREQNMGTDPLNDRRSVFRNIFIQGILLPLPSILYPTVMNMYDQNYSWCWIDSSVHPTAAWWQYGQYIATMLAVSILTVISSVIMRHNKDSKHTPLHRSFLRTSIFYQLAFVICILPAFFLDLVVVVHSYEIQIAVIFVEPLFDFFAGILFGFTESSPAPQSFDEAISNPSARPYVVEFLESTWTLENLSFVEAVVAYKQLHARGSNSDDAAKRKSRDYVVDRFVRSDALEEVNISAGDRANLIKAVDERDSLDAMLFDRAEREIRYLLSNMCFPQFLSSSQYTCMMELLNTSKVVAVRNRYLTPNAIFKRLMLVIRSKFASQTFSKRQLARRQSVMMTSRPPTLIGNNARAPLISSSASDF